MSSLRTAPNQAPVAGGARLRAAIGHDVFGYSLMSNCLAFSWNQVPTTKRLPRRLESSPT